MKEFCQKIDIEFDEHIYKKFEIYMDELIKYNKNINLTSITDEEQIINRHFLDSISIFKYKIKDFSYICDVGSGGGFPGIPMKIIRNDIKIDLIESNNKKVRFLKHMILKLELDNINVICERIENVSREKNFLEKYDYVTSRAMARLCKLIEMTMSILKIGGKHIYFKGVKYLEELDESQNAIGILGGKLNSILSVDEVSKLIIIDKIKKTPNMYPRNYNIIIKKPL